MLRYFLGLSLIFHVISSTAQGTRIGYINSDSLLLLMPGYAAQMDTIYHFRMKVDTAVRFMQAELDQKIADLDSTRHSTSALLVAMKEHEINNRRKNIEEFRQSMNLEIQAETNKRTKQYKDRLSVACKTVGDKNNCEFIFGTAPPPLCWKAGNMELINLTSQVAAELGLGKR